MNKYLQEALRQQNPNDNKVLKETSVITESVKGLGGSWKPVKNIVRDLSKIVKSIESYANKIPDTALNDDGYPDTIEAAAEGLEDAAADFEYLSHELKDLATSPERWNVKDERNESVENEPLIESTDEDKRVADYFKEQIKEVEDSLDEARKALFEHSNTLSKLQGVKTVADVKKALKVASKTMKAADKDLDKAKSQIDYTEPLMHKYKI